jgi:3-methyladenine DNA glycosylase Tag
LHIRSKKTRTRHLSDDIVIAAVATLGSTWRASAKGEKRQEKKGLGRVTSFKVIRVRAEKRKGGAAALQKLLPPIPDADAMVKLGDDRVLAEMTRRVFCAGFAWSVIEAKWQGFEEAFLGFQPDALAFKPDEFWEALTSDARIVRNGAKIMSVRANARFVQEIAKEHGSFGRLLANWPSSDEIGLLDLLAKRGSRLGGNTGQMLLRFLGWDGFVTSKDVVACLRDAGLDIAEEVKSKKDLGKVQAQFNAWAGQTGLPYLHLSRICAMSTGENYEARQLTHRANRGD